MIQDPNPNTYRMKDLVSLSGVSKQTIHFYLREGILSPPVRTSKNMAYYDAATVDDIRFIKELQERRYLPLAVIKEIIKAKREGFDLADDDHLMLLEQLFDRAQNDVADSEYDEKDFLSQTGLSESELSQLIQTGLISHSQETGILFDGYDFIVAEGIKELIEMGMCWQDLEIYADFLRFYRLEIRLVHDRIIHQDPEERHRPIGEIYQKTEKIKNLLKAKAHREFLMYSNHGENTD